MPCRIKQTSCHLRFSGTAGGAAATMLLSGAGYMLDKAPRTKAANSAVRGEGGGPAAAAPRAGAGRRRAGRADGQGGRRRPVGARPPGFDGGNGALSVRLQVFFPFAFLLDKSGVLATAWSVYPGVPSVSSVKACYPEGSSGRPCGGGVGVGVGMGMGMGLGMAMVRVMGARARRWPAPPWRRATHCSRPPGGPAGHPRFRCG